jgi:6-phosphogluconolactonase
MAGAQPTMPNPPPVVVVASAERLRTRFVAFALRGAAEALAAHGRFALAVPGGSVVASLLAALPAAPLPWARTDVFWCDERAVPASDVRSNLGASAAGWLGALSTTGVRIHPMLADADTLVADAAHHAARLVAALGTPPVLDLAVLGVGEDGHVASLFPGHPALEVRDRWVLAIDDAPKAPPARLTLTLPVLTAARRLVVAAFGEGKRAVMREALEDAACPLPVARVLRASAQALVLLDEAAGAGLTTGRPGAR